MAKVIDYVLQDAATLLEVITANRDLLRSKGFTEAERRLLIMPIMKQSKRTEHR